MKQVISFSRRTDGPAFYMNRLENAIKVGHINVRNPINKKYYKVSLRPSDVAGFVLWSKNFSPLLKKWQIFEPFVNKNLYNKNSPYPLYFQFTRNSPNAILEPRIPSLDDSIKQLREIVELTSPNNVMWRFDPIVFWKEKGEIFNNVRGFREIANNFSDIGVKNCTISFATYYLKVKRRMKKISFQYYEPSFKEKAKVVELILNDAKKFGIKIHVCSNPDILTIHGVNQAHCIDGNLLSRLWGVRVSIAKDTGQRINCGCTKSKDIGGYEKEWACHFKCLYCYANVI
ncbi:MAG: DUF1848 family protein [Promethearchaeota archaeon]